MATLSFYKGADDFIHVRNPPILNHQDFLLVNEAETEEERNNLSAFECIRSNHG